MKRTALFLAGVVAGFVASDLLSESLIKKLWSDGIALDVDVAFGRDDSWDADAHRWATRSRTHSGGSLARRHLS